MFDALPLIIDYLQNPLVNGLAIRIISSVFYGGVRDPLQIALSGLFGPRCVWAGQPCFLDLAAMALPYVLPFSAIGAVAPYFLPWVNSLVATVISGAVDRFSGVMIRDKLFKNDSYIVAGTGIVDRFSTFATEFRGWVAVKVQDGLGKTFQAEENWNSISPNVESTLPITHWDKLSDHHNVQIHAIRRIVSD